LTQLRSEMKTHQLQRLRYSVFVVVNCLFLLAPLSPAAKMELGTCACLPAQDPCFLSSCFLALVTPIYICPFNPASSDTNARPTCLFLHLRAGGRDKCCGCLDTDDLRPSFMPCLEYSLQLVRGVGEGFTYCKLLNSPARPLIPRLHPGISPALSAVVLPRTSIQSYSLSYMMSCDLPFIFLFALPLATQ
jgi:hypothetical protein